ncbi:hypothetical protein [Rickettsiella endosymbiont of Miltochrista miniata]|uniref:hypothetical protein n=1 Tax=Rickettsiella endosymbiont of Miltochrista miniata TaxID=3066239 RepID=UPI00313F254E
MAEIRSEKKLDDEKNTSLQILNVELEEDEEGGDAGGITLSIEQLNAYLLAAFKKERRQRIDGQKKFGVSPFSEDPNNLLGKKNSRSCGFGESPKIHPLLAHSQQFSGDDPTISANPIYDDSDKARERFLEKRLENQLRLQKNLGLGASKSVTLAR